MALRTRPLGAAGRIVDLLPLPLDHQLHRLPQQGHHRGKPLCEEVQEVLWVRSGCVGAAV